MTIERKIDVEIDLTPEELALEFWKMDSEQQVEFFNTLGSLVGSKFPFQLQFVSDSDALMLHGRYAMQVIGEYGGQK